MLIWERNIQNNLEQNKRRRGITSAPVSSAGSRHGPEIRRLETVAGNLPGEHQKNFSCGFTHQKA